MVQWFSYSTYKPVVTGYISFPSSSSSETLIQDKISYDPGGKK